MNFQPLVPTLVMTAIIGALLTACGTTQTGTDSDDASGNETATDDSTEQAPGAPIAESLPPPPPASTVSRPAPRVAQDSDPAAQEPDQAGSDHSKVTAAEPVIQAAPEPIAASEVKPPDASPATKKAADTAPPVAAEAVSDEITEAASDTAVPGEEEPDQLEASDTRSLLANFTLEQLPITVKDTWIISAEGDSCSLNTLTQIMDDGQGETPISLSLGATRWLLRTQSDIDLSYSGTGLLLDNGTHFELENVVRETSIEFVAQRQALIDALQDASLMTVSLGFWPTWPMTEARVVRFPVQHFPTAYALWQTCNRRISAP